MSTKYIIAPNFPGEAADGSLSFAGILRKYFIEEDITGKNIGISKSWNENTRSAFIQDYSNRLLPALQTVLSGKAVAEYTSDDFEAVLDLLDKKYHYADTTLLHYRHLLWAVYKAGFQHHEYADNVFWDDIFDPTDASPEAIEKHRIRIMTKTRRSFSIQEELKIADWFNSLDPTSAPGEAVGLLLMLFLGLRNNEACGANWSSLHPLDGYPDVYVLDVIQSTKSGSTDLKPGGKTRNAPRVLPVVAPLYHFLEKRRQFIEVQIGSDASAANLPMVCRDTSFTERCATKYLTIAARHLFEDVGITKNELSVLNQILCSHEFKDSLIAEKEPTAYLFRRNHATHLYQMGFAMPEIQYLMGHDIEDVSLTRNFFSDPDILSSLFQKIQQHPLLQAIPGFIPNSTVSWIPSSSLQVSGTSESTIDLTIEGKSPAKTVLLTIDALEPDAELEFSCASATPLNLDVTHVPGKSAFASSAIISQVQPYRRHMGKAE